MSYPQHPGTITFVDLDTGSEHVEDAATVDEHIAFAEVGDDVFAPVVKVTNQRRGKTLELTLYGVDGAVLQRVYGG